MIGSGPRHCKLHGKESLILQRTFLLEVRLERIRRRRRGGFHEDANTSQEARKRLFHLHPQHALFSLVASFVLAVLAVLILVSSAR